MPLDVCFPPTLSVDRQLHLTTTPYRKKKNLLFISILRKMR